MQMIRRGQQAKGSFKSVAHDKHPATASFWCWCTQLSSLTQVTAVKILYSVCAVVPTSTECVAEDPRYPVSPSPLCPPMWASPPGALRRFKLGNFTKQKMEK